MALFIPMLIAKLLCVSDAARFDAGLASNASWTTVSHHYVLANASFATRAPILIVEKNMASSDLKSAQAKGVIVMLDTLVHRKQEWAAACAAAQCVGVYFFNGETSNAGLLDTYQYWRVSKPFSGIPIVMEAIDTSAATLAWIASVGGPGSVVHVSIDSIADNETHDAVRAPSVLLFSSLTIFTSITGIIVGIVQISRFATSREGVRSTPKWAAIIIPLETVANIVRAMFAVNVAVFRGQGLEYPLWRFACTAPMTLSNGAMMCMATAFVEILSPSKAKTWQEIGVFCGQVVVSSMCIADIVLSTLSGLTEHEITDNANLAVAYFLISLPIVICFIIYGGKLSKRLIAIRGDSNERYRHAHFARRIVASGIIGVSELSALVLFAVVSSTSVTWWYASYFCYIFMTALAGIIHQVAFRPPANPFDRFFNSRIVPSSTLKKLAP